MPGAIVIAGAGFVAVAGSWVTYMATVPSGKVPVRPIGHIVAQVLGVALGVAGISMGVTAGGLTLVGTIALGSLSIPMGLLFPLILSQRKTPIGSLAVQVGEPLLPFSATDSQGRHFDSESLRGQRVLLKFFRGHW